MKRQNIFLVIAIVAVLALVGCSGKKEASGGSAEGGSSGNRSSQTAVAAPSEGIVSIKYAKGNETYIMTVAEDNETRRLDHITANGTHSIYIVIQNSPNDFSGYIYENGNWEDRVQTAMRNTNGFPWKSRHLNYKDAGFADSDTAMLGYQCRAWSGNAEANGKVANYARYTELPENNSAEIVVLNNRFTMRLKSGNNVELEATAIAFNVPDTAFTNTTDISWIK